ncbi:response regulator [Lacinutrix undariae]
MKKIKNICIIDDDPIYIFAVKRILELSELGENFIIYKNGEKAIKGITETINNNEKLPDLILLDINMPVMDGWQFLDQFLLLNPPKSTILFIASSSIDYVDIEKSKTYDIIANYLLKPFSRKQILEMVENIRQIQKTL